MLLRDTKISVQLWRRKIRVEQVTRKSYEFNMKTRCRS